MKTINIKKQVKGTSTNMEGFALKCILQPFLNKREVVKVSFENTTPMSSSFFNSSFGELIDEYGYDVFRLMVKPVNITAQHMSLIKQYIQWHNENEVV